MKVLIIGLGSMGKRRLRLLKKIDRDFKFCGVDSRVDRCNEIKSEYGITTYSDLQLAFDNFKPESVIISTSPLTHADIIETSLNNGSNVFTEINLVNNKYTTNIELAKQKGLTLFLSSTNLYKKEIVFIDDKVSNCNCKLNYIYHVGQYLPDWHPWEKINDFFVTDIRTNGCREIFAIELPWLIKTFGKIKSFKLLKDNITSLNLKYNDNFVLLFEHTSGHKGMLAVDVASQKATRRFELYGESMYLNWDGTPNGLFLYNPINKNNDNIVLYDYIDKEKNYADSIIENAYMDELTTFFDVLDNKSVARYTFDDDLYTLDLINKIENYN